MVSGEVDIPGIAGIFDAESGLACPVCWARDVRGARSAATMSVAEIQPEIVITSIAEVTVRALRIQPVRVQRHVVH